MNRFFLGCVSCASIILAVEISVDAKAAESIHGSNFVIVMDGPISLENGTLSADLYSIGGQAVGRSVRGGPGNSCTSFSDDVTPPAFLTPCEDAPVLKPGQMYYEESVTFDLPGGTLVGTLKAYEVYNSNPPVLGGDQSATAIEEGVITGGTGQYDGVRGTFSSRVKDEFKLMDFGDGNPVLVPYVFDHSLIIFNLVE